MTWIADAISNSHAEIMERVTLLISERETSRLALPPDEIRWQAKMILELLISQLRNEESTAFLDRWETMGESCSERGLAMAEVPDTPDLVNRAIWGEMEKRVEEGKVSLPDLVDAMMDVESVLSECRFAMMRVYLGSRDIKVTERTKRMEALYSLADLLSREGDESETYPAIAEKVASITGLGRCSLLAFLGGEELELVACNRGDAIGKIRDSATDLATLKAVVLLGGPVILEKGVDNPPEIERLLDDYGTTAALLVPMRSGEKYIGLLLLDQGGGGEFVPEQIELAVACANQVAVTVEKSGLFAEMEGKLKHMAAVGIVARTLSSFLDPDEQYQSLLEMATALAHADSGAILLPEEMFGDLKEAAGIGDAGWVGDKAFRNVAEWVNRHGEAVLLHKGVKDPRFGDVDVRVEASITSPLMVRGKIIGVIAVGSGSPDERYTSGNLEMFGNFAAQAAVSIENTKLNERLQDTYLGAIASLAAAIEASDPYTVGHSARVTQYAVSIAESMGLSSGDVEEVKLAALLHDLGKIGVPDSILNKAGRLTEEEYSVIKMHPVLSTRIIEPLPHLGNIIPIIHHHHERYDGLGYVDGKSGDDIPLGARILAVADSFEAMTSDRPYRKALSREEAMAEVRRNSGSQFDPEVVWHFMDLLEKIAPVD
ncbi:MAG: GAF domain-containing protein [Actinomycetia bacterium]|nr:GAF domain-containing protein [Actinomycetes bacterium]